MKRIESAHNPLVKALRRLAHPRKRGTEFLVEGRKLVDTAIASGAVIETIVLSTAYRDEPISTEACDVVQLSESLFQSVSSLESPEGILAVVRRPAVTPPRSGVVAVAAGIQDPGNLGALARVVEASGGSGLVVLRGSADPFGPKAVRGSMGSMLRVPVWEASDLSELSGFPKAALVPRGGPDFRAVEWRLPLALVLGSESRGVDEATLRHCDLRVSIPMRGQVESLNVAAAAALVLYEVSRPR